MAKYKLRIELNFECEKLDEDRLAKMIRDEWTLGEKMETEIWERGSDLEFKIKYGKGRVRVTKRA